MWQPLPNTDKIDEVGNARRHHYIIAYGNGSWRIGIIWSKLPAPTKQLQRHLHRLRRRWSCIISVLMIDEYLTSKICPNCRSRTVKNLLELGGNGNRHCQKFTFTLCWSVQFVARRGTEMRWLPGNLTYTFNYMAHHNNDGLYPFANPKTPTLSMTAIEVDLILVLSFNVFLWIVTPD